MSVSLEQVAPLVGSSFMVRTQQGPVELTLASASERSRRGLPAQFRVPLSLIFHGAASAQLAQGLFHFDHPLLGPQQWMLTPVLAEPDAAGAGSGCAHYEVYFS